MATRIAVNPITGATGPAALIGSLVKTGKGFVNGLYANGMGQSNKNGYPGGADRRPRHPVCAACRHRLPGEPKTVIRSGGGVFYDRLQGNPVFDMLPNPPSTAIPKFYYGNLASIPSAASGAFFPQSVNGFDRKGQIPTTYNWNFTIQRELPSRHSARRRLCRVVVQSHPVPLQPERDSIRSRLAAAEPGSDSIRVRSSTAPPPSSPTSTARISATTAPPLTVSAPTRTTTPCRFRPTAASARTCTFGVGLSRGRSRWAPPTTTTPPTSRSTSARPTTRCSATDREPSAGVQLRVQPAQVRQVEHGRRQGGRVDCEQLADLRHHLVPDRRADDPEFLDLRHRQPERALYRLSGCGPASFLRQFLDAIKRACTSWINASVADAAAIKVEPGIRLGAVLRPSGPVSRIGMSPSSRTSRSTRKG